MMTAAPVDWPAWLASWDRQQEWYLPNREERFGAMLDVVEAVAGRAPRVLDLACGPGSITARILARMPAARVVGVDVDPALLAIAGGVFADEPRVELVRADLADPAWVGALPERQLDAVVTATATHWLAPEQLERLYADLAGVVRPGGVVCNADHMPDGPPTALDSAVDALREQRREQVRGNGVVDWMGWWELAAAEPTLAEHVAWRMARFGGDGHPAEFTPDHSWHLERLRAAGFGRAAVVWWSHRDAVVAALR